MDLSTSDMGSVSSTSAAMTAPREANKTYVYTVRATWGENGRAVDQFRVVGVKAGETAKVNFLSQR